MRKVVQAGAVAGACGLVMLAGGIAHAQTTVPAPTAPQPSLLSAVLGADLGTAAVMASSVLCNNHLVDYNYKSPSDHSPHPCINGPVHSGNSRDSGNFINHGNPSSSGNFSSENGSTNSGNSYTNNGSDPAAAPLLAGGSGITSGTNIASRATGTAGTGVHGLLGALSP